MGISLLSWLGWDFVQIRCDGRQGGSAAEQGAEVFDMARAALHERGLSLSDTVRSRVFGVDRPARDAVSAARAQALRGDDRAASSSYIAPKLVAPGALVALDLIAVRPRPGVRRSIAEYAPPKQPICFVALGPLLVLSGNTSQLPTLREQLRQDILPRVAAYLDEGASSWRRIAEISCFLHESQAPEELRACFENFAQPFPPRFEVRFVEGFSAPDKLVEVEVTAERFA